MSLPPLVREGLVEMQPDSCGAENESRWASKFCRRWQAFRMQRQAGYVSTCELALSKHAMSRVGSSVQYLRWLHRAPLSEKVAALPQDCWPVCKLQSLATLTHYSSGNSSNRPGEQAPVTSNRFT